jgi:Protein of unknown function (DUF4012)
MTDPSGRHVSDGPAPESRRRPVLIIALTVVVLVLIAIGGWLSLRARSADHHVAAARSALERLERHLIEGRNVAARADAAVVRHQTKLAMKDTHDPVWRAVASIPFVGDTPRAVNDLVGVTNTLAHRPMDRLISVGAALSPQQLRTSGDTVDLRRVVTSAGGLAATARDLRAAHARIAHVGGAGVIGSVETARRDLVNEIDSIDHSVGVALQFARLGPKMLGADGVRRYFIAFENNAESRGSGGLIGAYAIVTADHGQVRVAHIGPNTQLRDASHPVVTMPHEYTKAYAGTGSTQAWREANLSPDFPSVARIWAALWRNQHPRLAVDGVLSMDPVAFSDILAATGPITFKNSRVALTANNVVYIIEQAVYSTEQNNARRRAALAYVADLVARQVLGGAGDSYTLARELAHASRTGHIHVWSRHPDEEAALRATFVGGALSTARAPYAELVVNNAAGGKLDVYLRRGLTYLLGGCSASPRKSTITVSLGNQAPTGLPPYVTFRADHPVGRPPYAQNRLLVRIYASHGAELTSATLDGKPTTLSVTTERGHAVFGTDLTIDRSTTRSLVLHILEPVLPGPPILPIQPLAVPEQVLSGGATCASGR